MTKEEIVAYAKSKINCEVTINEYSDCAKILKFHLEPECSEIVVSNNVREHDLDLLIECIKGGNSDGNS